MTPRYMLLEATFSEQCYLIINLCYVSWQGECMKSILESVLLQTDILWHGMCLMTFTVLTNVMYIWALGSGRLLPSSKYTAVMQYLSYEIPKPAISYVSRPSGNPNAISTDLFISDSLRIFEVWKIVPYHKSGSLNINKPWIVVLIS